MQKFDVIVIGGGASGLMAAMRAGQRGKRVVLLEHADAVGAKILISGGGRCNFTNLGVAPDRYLSQNPHFCKSALKGFTQRDFIALVEKHGIAYHEKTLGQLFCDKSARDIVSMLVAECRAAGVVLSLQQDVTEIDKGDGFTVRTRKDVFQAPALILATGGLSIPSLGATGLTYKMAEQFGLAVTETRPALVPLVFDQETAAFMHALSGVNLEVVARCGKTAFREGMVMTHRGLSGPAILQISSYWREGLPIEIDLMPDTSAEAFLLERKKARPKAEMKTILAEVLPQRLAQAMAGLVGFDEVIGQWPDKKVKEMAALLKGWRLMPSGTEGYAKAEVTAGGIDTAALSSKTMMVNDVPGLFIVGEAVDVTGWLGGYNFQWAWSSGWAAGSYA